MLKFKTTKRYWHTSLVVLKCGICPFEVSNSRIKTLSDLYVNGVFFPAVVSQRNLIRISFNCQRGNRANKRGCLGGRFIIPRDVGENSQILHKPLKLAFLTIFWCKTPYLGRDNGLVFTTRGPKLGHPVCSGLLSVQEDITDEQALIRFLV